MKIPSANSVLLCLKVFVATQILGRRFSRVTLMTQDPALLLCVILRSLATKNLLSLPDRENWEERKADASHSFSMTRKPIPTQRISFQRI